MDVVWESDVFVAAHTVGEDRARVATFVAVRLVVDGTVARYGEGCRDKFHALIGGDVRVPSHVVYVAWALEVQVVHEEERLVHRIGVSDDLGRERARVPAQLYVCIESCDEDVDELLNAAAHVEAAVPVEYLAQ